MEWITRLTEEESGQGMAEYALILSLVALAVIASVQGFGSGLAKKYLEIAGLII